MIWLWGLFVIALTVAITIALLCVVDARGHDVTQLINRSQGQDNA